MASEFIASVSEASTIARRYAKHLQDKEINPREVYLFGSFAKGTNHVDSDIDIAVVSDSFTGNSVEDMANLLYLKCDVDYRIEPHPFLPENFTTDNPFAEEIIRTGIRIA